MRALEFLFEAGLANNELRKHGGKYIELLVKKIKDGESLETVPAAKDQLGDRVTIEPGEASKVAQAYFGQDDVPALDTVQLADNGDVVPVEQLHQIRQSMIDDCNNLFRFGINGWQIHHHQLIGCFQQ